MQAADLLLRDGNFPLVFLDLMLNPLRELGKIPASNWYRFQRLVEPAPSAFLVVTPRSMISSAHMQIDPGKSLAPAASRWTRGGVAAASCESACNALSLTNGREAAMAGWVRGLRRVSIRVQSLQP